MRARQAKSEFIGRGKRHQKRCVIGKEFLRDSHDCFVQLSLHRVDTAAPIQKKAHGKRAGFERKMLHRRSLTVLENFLMGQNLGEWHSGMRAYHRRVLEQIPWERNSNDFVFDCEFLVQAAGLHFRIGDIPVPARYFEEASSINFHRSVRYGLESLRSILRYYLHRTHLYRCQLFEPKSK